MPLQQQYPYYEKTLEQSNKKPLWNLSTANNKLSFTKVSSNVFYIHGSLLSMDFLNISRQVLKHKNSSSSSHVSQNEGCLVTPSIFNLEVSSAYRECIRSSSIFKNLNYTINRHHHDHHHHHHQHPKSIPRPPISLKNPLQKQVPPRHRQGNHGTPCLISRQLQLLEV